jgi:tRNA threonylcarbamoyladenosine modification (KEOPS) complex  Pcc1 subunit
MKYRSSIVVAGDADKILECFKADDHAHKTDRSSYTISKEDDAVIFSIVADDSVALRATLNSITKLLTVFDKVKELEND